MRLWPRRSSRTSKEDALARARRAAAGARRDQERTDRYRRRKQAGPTPGMTPNQWIGGS